MSIFDKMREKEISQRHQLRVLDAIDRIVDDSMLFYNRFQETGKVEDYKKDIEALVYYCVDGNPINQEAIRQIVLRKVPDWALDPYTEEQFAPVRDGEFGIRFVVQQMAQIWKKEHQNDTKEDYLDALESQPDVIKDILKIENNLERDKT